MAGLKFDFKGLLALVVVLCSFGLFAGDMLIRGGAEPTATVVGFSSGGLMLVLGFYFGSHNGTVATMLEATARNAALAETLRTLAAQRRHADPSASSST